MLRAAKRKKIATSEVGLHNRVKLVVLGVEVGGRWSDETCTCLSQLAKARARTEMPLMRRRTSLEIAVESHLLDDDVLSFSFSKRKRFSARITFACKVINFLSTSSVLLNW